MSRTNKTVPIKFKKNLNPNWDKNFCTPSCDQGFVRDQKKSNRRRNKMLLRHITHSPEMYDGVIFHRDIHDLYGRPSW